MSTVEPTPGAASQLKAHEHAQKRDWPGYYRAVAGKGPRETLLKALELFDKEAVQVPAKTAVDLGCGSGRDTFELLRRGWTVIAMDSHPMGLDLLKADTPPEHAARLTAVVTKLESYTPPSATLINASYTLPFCDPDAFPDLWRRIVNAIPRRGRFAGQFFGERDDWASIPDRSHHTRPQVERLLADFTIDSLQEVVNREPGATGEIKNWHIFHVVAQKRAG